VSSWSFNSDDGETARIRFFTDSPPPFNVPQATQLTYSVARPAGGIIVRDTVVASLPAEVAVPPDVSPAKLLNIRANGHLRMEKISGSDRGFYAAPCIPQPGHFGANFAGGPAGIGPPLQSQPSQAPLLGDDDGAPVALIAGVGVAVLLAGFGSWLYFTSKRRSLAIQTSTHTSVVPNGPPGPPTATVVQASPEQTLGSGTPPATNMIGSVTPTVAQPQPALFQEPASARAAVPDAELTKPPPSGLSMREVEVVTLIAKGYTNKQIAQELSISDATAKRHIENILRKLGLETRTQVAIWATQNGYRNGPSKG
jgi:DNA-binding CsgD family transcriptional regulator